jgi:glucan phosphoethanolaminetransferase (alkaline phosphatase superfamily)
MKKDKVIRVLLFYLALLALFAWIGEGPSSILRITNRIYVYHGIPKTAFYVAAYLGAIAGLTVLYLSGNRIIRYSSYLVSFFSIALFLCYKRVNGYGYNFYDAKMAVSVYGWRYTHEAVETFLPYCIWPIVLALLFVLAVETLHRKLLPKVGPYGVILPLLAIFPIYAINVRTLGEISNFPVVYEVPVLSYVAKFKDLPLGQRAEPYMKPAGKAFARHVVFIVDESIRGDMLSINGYHVNTTPYLISVADGIINLGVASASTNCSSTSHIVLEAGIRIDQLPDNEYKTLKQPNLFQYARQAGYRTFILDGPNSWGRPYEWIGEKDLLSLDAYSYVRKENPGIQSYEIDYKIIQLINKIIQSQDSSFIFVIKYGCHFSYENDYPHKNKPFAPTTEDVQDNNLQAVLNSYYNAVIWSVDGFFQKLLPTLRGKDVIVVYTSDHGQSIEAYRTLPATHCVGKNPPCTQASVPIMLFPMDAATADAFKPFSQTIGSNYDKASHYQLFPTLLQIMGYAPGDISKYYGPTLFDRLGGKREFISGTLYGRGFFQKHPFQLPAKTP